jgi:hypothetical protein
LTLTLLSSLTVLSDKAVSMSWLKVSWSKVEVVPPHPTRTKLVNKTINNLLITSPLFS